MVTDNMGLSKKRIFGTADGGSFDSCKLLGISKAECRQDKTAKMIFVNAVNRRTKKIQKVKRKAVRNKRLI